MGYITSTLNLNFFPPFYIDFKSTVKPKWICIHTLSSPRSNINIGLLCFGFHLISSNMFCPCFCLFLLALFFLKFWNYAFEDFPGKLLFRTSNLVNYPSSIQRRLRSFTLRKVKVMHFAHLVCIFLVIST